MADDWAGLANGLGKMQTIWYVAARSYWSVFDPDSDIANIVAEDGSTRQVPSWRALNGAITKVRADGVMPRSEVSEGQQDAALPMGVYPVRRNGETDLMLDVSVALGSARRLQLLAQYGNELFFRVARDGVDAWQGVGSRKNRIWHSGNIEPLTTNTTQTITAEKTFSSSINSTIAGGAYLDWKWRPATVVLSCPRNDSAYAIWRAVQYGTRYLGAFDVHANSSDTGVVSAVMHLNGGGDAVYSHSWSGPNYEAPGNIIAGGVIRTGQFTRATLPIASTCPGAMAIITDGPSGPTHVFSNGQKWRVPTMTDL